MLLEVQSDRNLSMAICLCIFNTSRLPFVRGENSSAAVTGSSLTLIYLDVEPFLHGLDWMDLSRCVPEDRAGKVSASVVDFPI